MAYNQKRSVLAFVFAVLLLAGSAFGAEPVAKISGPETAKVDSTILIGSVGSKWDANAVNFQHPFSNATLLLSLDGSPVLVVQQIPPGKHTVYFTASGVLEDGTVRQVSDSLTVTVGGPNPPPKPPTPDPDPPEPTPDVAPIPVAGFRVLIVYESKDAAKLSPGQQAIVAGARSREYLNKTCAKEESTGNAAYRIYDQHVDTMHDLEVWRNAMKRERDSLPWLVVSNGKTGFEGPLPDSVDAFLELCGRFE